MGLLKTLAGPVSNLLGGWMQSRQQNRNINATNRANLKLANLRYDQDKQMAQYAFDKNLEMWKLQNQYNSPEAQMKRFEDAGLSKHMIYGQGSPGNATVSPSYTPPAYQPPTMDFRGKQSPTANTLSQYVGTLTDVAALKTTQAKAIEQEAQSAIAKVNKGIAEATERDNIQAIFNKNGIVQQQLEQEYINTLRKSYGVDGASEITKAWFANMINADVTGMKITEKQRKEILRQIRMLTITREAKQALTEMVKLIPGLGKLIKAKK